MKRELLICVCALTVVASTTDRIYACCEDPVPCFTVTPNDAKCVGTTITFDASFSYDPDDTTLTYDWDFGDGETGTGEIVTHSYDEGGDFTVTLTVTDNDNDECCDSSDPNCEDHEDEDSATVGVLEVDLGKLSAGCSPDLPPCRICLNAQDCYNKAKWKAIIKGGGTANVTSTGLVTVTFSGIDGSDPSALANNDEFWAIGGTEIGSYAITIKHNDQSTCEDTDDDKVFKFKFDDPVKTDDNGGMTPAEATRSDPEGWVDAPKIEEPAATDSAGFVEWFYDLKVITDPSGLYSGNVQAKANVTFESDGKMRIYCFPRPIGYDTFGISVSWGIVSVSMPNLFGVSDYGDAITGADLETKIGDLARVQLGDVEHNSEEVGTPFGIPVCKTWDGPSDGVDLSQERSDIERTYAVGSTINELIFKVGVGSDISLCIGPEGTWAQQNKQAISSVAAEEYDDLFEIVP
jgi:hypothetical protein